MIRLNLLSYTFLWQRQTAWYRWGSTILNPSVMKDDVFRQSDCTKNYMALIKSQLHFLESRLPPFNCFTAIRNTFTLGKFIQPAFISGIPLHPCMWSGMSHPQANQWTPSKLSQNIRKEFTSVWWYCSGNKAIWETSSQYNSCPAVFKHPIKRPQYTIIWVLTRWLRE